MDTITIEVKEVADKKQLFFHGTVGEPPPPPPRRRRQSGPGRRERRRTRRCRVIAAENRTT